MKENKMNFKFRKASFPVNESKETKLKLQKRPLKGKKSRSKRSLKKPLQTVDIGSPAQVS